MEFLLLLLLVLFLHASNVRYHFYQQFLMKQSFFLHVLLDQLTNLLLLNILHQSFYRIYILQRHLQKVKEKIFQVEMQQTAIMRNVKTTNDKNTTHSK